MKKPIVLKTLDALTPEVLLLSESGSAEDRPLQPVGTMSETRSATSSEAAGALRSPATRWAASPAYLRWGINE